MENTKRRKYGGAATNEFDSGFSTGGSSQASSGPQKSFVMRDLIRKASERVAEVAKDDEEDQYSDRDYDETEDEPKKPKAVEEVDMSKLTRKQRAMLRAKESRNPQIRARAAAFLKKKQQARPPKPKPKPAAAETSESGEQPRKKKKLVDDRDTLLSMVDKIAGHEEATAQSKLQQERSKRQFFEQRKHKSQLNKEKRKEMKQQMVEELKRKHRQIKEEQKPIKKKPRTGAPAKRVSFG
eukprot:TRINITY_DN7168_c0_g1_i1.p1 TRINITY_DN7168_c0_g1~~TRINITY_DN7168_c0_g1_i1.p1  ORF type:complete len:239 (+),score=71.01 TRINITY_DN7168_c0_g1_i1:47-763(+)